MALVVSMLAALVSGCGAKNEDSGKEDTEKKEQTTYEKIMDKGVLTVGTEGTYQPFTYHDESDTLTGYDVEVAKAIGEKMGVKVEFSEITWEGLLASLDNGTVDLVLNQVGVTDERKEKYDFSDPYLYSYIALIVNKDHNDITSWDTSKGKKTSLKIRRNCMHLEGRILGSVFSLGISPFIMNATESFISIVLNHGLQTYGGDLHVGSLTIMQSIMQLFSAPINGFTQGMTPIVSYNYGARNFSRVKQLYCWMIGMCFGFRFLSTATTMFLPRFYAGFFTNETQLVALTGEVMPIFMAGMLVFGLQNGIQPTFLALGQAKISLFIAVLRKIILLIPLAIILPHFMGVMGVYWAEPISDTLSAATASILFMLNIKKILSEESLAKIQ